MNKKIINKILKEIKEELEHYNPPKDVHKFLHSMPTYATLRPSTNTLNLLRPSGQEMSGKIVRNPKGRNKCNPCGVSVSDPLILPTTSR